MTHDEIASLVESIQMNGLREPIVLLGDQVLDGWHRYQACRATGMEAVFEVYEGDDPVAYVSDKHNRRSLNLTQRMVAIALMNRWAPSGAAGHKSKVALSSTLTHADLAKQAGGSKKTAQQVKAAITTGRKEVVKAMQDGELSARRAAEIAKLPQKEQVKAITAPPKPKKVEAEEREYFGPSNEEIEAAESGARADMAALELLVQSDDKLATALQEVNRLKAELAVVSLSRDGYMNRCNELITRIKTLKRQLELAKEPARV